MHPVLSRRGRLDLYLAAWIPAAGLLTVALGLPGHRSWPEAGALAVQLAVDAAFMSLALWPLCKAMPVDRADRASFYATHAAAILATTSLWVLLGGVWAQFLGVFALFQGALDRYRADVPVIAMLGALLFIMTTLLHYMSLAFENAREAERTALESQVQAREAEVRALRAQINPHFLFNSLNAVASLAGSDPARARSMCVMLSDFLRRSLGLGSRQEVTLAEEIDLVERYLAIEQVRFGDRLHVVTDIDPAAGGCLLPALLLQPLVENAITHGIAHSIEGGTVSVTARRTGSRLDIVIENPAESDRPPSRGQGMGVANVRGRLASLHPGAARIETREADGRYRVDLVMPAVEAVVTPAMAGPPAMPALARAAR